MFPDDLNQKASGIWDRNAGFWDGHFKEGNDFHRLLVSPSIERLLELQPGEQVLDVACGNGALARRLADLGAQVTAALPVPTVGIGAGPGCDAQVLVFHDLLGLYADFTPKFVKRYADLGSAARAALSAYAREVREGTFPGPEHSFR